VENLIQVERKVYEDMREKNIIDEWKISSKEKKSKRKKYYVPLTGKVKSYLKKNEIEFQE